MYRAVGAHQDVSREPRPPLPGGYAVGEQVYYTGAAGTFENGDRVVHGEQGEVVGPAISVKGVAVRFPGNKGTVSCHLWYLYQVRRRAAAARSHAELPIALQLPYSCPSSPPHPQCTVWAHR